MFPGSDGIYPRILRKAREEIAGELRDIFVSSLATGEFPEDWRIDNVVPLFKKGSRDNPGNYRLFFKEVTKMIDEEKVVDVVYMNFSKAFDKVPHVLAPLLFVIYINDLEENVVDPI
eukprot:g24421.t1